ncbi:hypothetical protein WJX73_001688 [Symbiochloris irregularis]|uniref:Structure-specific endonuclease subunit SLX1 homolog n=1 Tax=Symbiochloris irregularis TaxID=706552 RepID=A0AAW1NQH5_9CHLO
MGNKFYGCYLLASKHNKGSNRTYIGFTVKPERRIRQHNGEITAGASRTKKWRPWDMVCVVYGFSTKTQALQFEWAWQHPEKSKAVREAAAALSQQKKRGPAGKVRLLVEMVRGQPWVHFPLTLHFTSSTHSQLRLGCPPLPSHMHIEVAPLQVLAQMTSAHAEDSDDEDHDPGDGGGDSGDDGDAHLEDESGIVVMSDREPEQEDEVAAASQQVPDLKVQCAVCGKGGMQSWLGCPCGARCHISCLAHAFLQGQPSAASLPASGRCPSCQRHSTWAEALSRAGNIGWKQNRKAAGKKRGTRKSPKAVRTNAEAGSPKKATAARKKDASVATGRRRKAVSPRQVKEPATKRPRKQATPRKQAAPAAATKFQDAGDAAAMPSSISLDTTPQQTADTRVLSATSDMQRRRDAAELCLGDASMLSDPLDTFREESAALSASPEQQAQSAAPGSVVQLRGTIEGVDALGTSADLPASAAGQGCQQSALRSASQAGPRQAVPDDRTCSSRPQDMSRLIPRGLDRVNPTLQQTAPAVRQHSLQVAPAIALNSPPEAHGTADSPSPLALRHRINFRSRRRASSVRASISPVAGPRQAKAPARSIVKRPTVICLD